MTFSEATRLYEVISPTPSSHFRERPSRDWLYEVMVERPVSDVIYILRLPHGRKEIMLHHDLLKRYVPRGQSLVPLGWDVKEHGIHDWEIELESEEEDSHDEIYLEDLKIWWSQKKETVRMRYLDGHKIWKDDRILSNYLV